MFGREPKPSSRVDILIGKTARIRGDIDFSVSEGACIEGSVEVANVVLNGTVKGDIRAARHVVLGPSAKVQGNVYYGSIESASGAEILGKLVPANEPPSSEQAEAAPQHPV